MHPLSSISEQAFAGVARARHARALHPRGTVVRATWTIEDPASVLAGVLGTGPQAAVVRLSRGLGLPRPLPDVRGIAIRLDVAGRTVDLLLSGTAHRMSTLLPYRRRSALVLVGVRRRPDGGFLIRERRPLRPGRTVGRLDVDGPVGDRPTPFDPYRHRLPGFRPVRFLSRVREAAYAGSRRGRSG
ncbi:hypothetical protein [Nocardioides sp. CER19]|uniref:hypothetical protein n=1 Tax=Nocardioides sp. CER19 TaxID=3038538 RepID=UPI00244881B2|nr:hypothetical protein [Nocardioides sp. CER19]MDH2415761.1 hypothetical protein [Nocardioides sp. CER19]